MPLNPYNLFISHSWAYTDSYEKFLKLLDNSSYFTYRNFSIPKEDPVHTESNLVLKSAIENKIQRVHAVIILAGVYSTYSKWINIEIEVAQKSFSNKKPIIAVEPWGSERTSTTVKNAADRIVKWNTESIISAIKTLC